MLSFPGYHKYCCNEHWAANIFLNYSFKKNYNGNSIFNFLRNLHIGCTNLHSHNSVGGFLFQMDSLEKMDKVLERRIIFYFFKFLSCFSLCDTAAAAAAKSLQSCPNLCDLIDGSLPVSPSLGFSRQEHWSGLPFPTPMHESESEVAQSCLTLRDPMDYSPPGPSIHGFSRQEYLSRVPSPSPM